MKVFVSLLICLLLVQCNGKKESNNHFKEYINKHQKIVEKAELVDVDSLQVKIISYDKTSNISPEIINVELIKLETPQEIVIGSVSKVITTKSGFIIFDKKTNSIFIFNKSGQFTNRIRNSGKGPGEYLNLNDIIYDKVKKHIIVFEKQMQKIIVYDNQGRFIKEKSIGFWFHNFTGLTNDGFVCFTNNANRSGYSLIFLDSTFNIFGKGIHSNYSHHAYSDSPIFTSYDGQVAFMLPFGNKFYQLSEGKIIQKYKIQYGDLSVNEKILEKQGEVETIMTALQNSPEKGIFSLGGHAETDDYILFDLFITEDSRFRKKALLYDQETNKGYRFDLKYKDLWLKFPLAVDDEQLISVVYPHILKADNTRLKGTVLDNLTIDILDNPYLLKYNLKY